MSWVKGHTEWASYRVLCCAVLCELWGWKASMALSSTLSQQAKLLSAYCSFLSFKYSTEMVFIFLISKTKLFPEIIVIVGSEYIITITDIQSTLLWLVCINDPFLWCVVCCCLFATTGTHLKKIVQRKFLPEHSFLRTPFREYIGTKMFPYDFFRQLLQIFLPKNFMILARYRLPSSLIKGLFLM